MPNNFVKLMRFIHSYCLIGVRIRVKMDYSAGIRPIGFLVKPRGT